MKTLTYYPSESLSWGLYMGRRESQCAENIGLKDITRSHRGGTISRGELIIYGTMATPDISSSSENISNTARVSRLSFHFLWLWYDSEEPI